MQEENDLKGKVSRRAMLGTLAAASAGAGASMLVGNGGSQTAQAAGFYADSTQTPFIPSYPLGKVGFTLAHEQFPSTDLAQFATMADKAGFDNVWTSDHFQPWQDNEGHSGFPWNTLMAIGGRTHWVGMGTSVTCPTFRHRPTDVAQSFATLSQYYPGRVVLGVGTGEALNEQAATGQWGPYQERADRLIEAISIIRQMWSGQTVNFQGKYFQVVKARLYDPPARPIPLYVAASGPKSMRLAGMYGDGLITDPKRAMDPTMRAAFEAGARAVGKDPAQLPVIVEAFTVVGDQAEAEKYAELWRFLPKAWSDYVNIPDPVEIRRRADAEVAIADVVKDWTISTSPQVHANAILKLLNSGMISHVQIHSPQADQAKVINFFGSQVLPLLKQPLGLRSPQVANPLLTNTQP